MMTETAHATGRPGSGTGPFREGSAVHIPGRLDAEDDERIPPDEVCLSLHSLELANLGYAAPSSTSRSRRSWAPGKNAATRTACGWRS